MSKSPIALPDLFRYYKGLPHQMAAVQQLGELIPPELLSRDQDWFKTWSTDGKQPSADWLTPAQQIVKEFEGCKLQAYPDPSTGGQPWTIGWGSTTIGGKVVQPGQSITQAQADAQLDADLQRFYDALAKAIPAVSSWPPNRIAALVSWTYNIGVGAMQGSTLRKRLLAGEDPAKVAAEELPRWNKASGRELPGLTRRRAAELALFLGRPPLQQTGGFGNPLQVPFYQQMDSADRAQAARMCFSSSCAMLLQYLKPGTLHGPNGDDQYLRRVQQYGDTTDPRAQVRALSSYGIRAQFTKVAGFAQLEQQIANGVPIPCGFLHRGPVSKPTGSGHWLIVVGHTKTDLIVHDPFGMADLVTGATLSGTARFANYSRRHFSPRWMVEGDLTGWAIIAER
jgi:GH24 family phage-related lysozyme (muramidase)